MLKWQHRLEAVLKRSVAIFDGADSEEFWSQVFTLKGYGSGWQHQLSGWITVFATIYPGGCMGSAGFELDGVRFGCLYFEDFPADTVTVPIQIDDHGDKLMGLMAAGILGAQKINDTTIGLQRAWWIFENKTGGWVE
jgi:hypothetical protein